MEEIKVNMSMCQEEKISPSMYCFLYQAYFKKVNWFFFGDAVIRRAFDRGYLLNNDPDNLIVSNEKVEVLLGLKANPKINPSDFIKLFPVTVVGANGASRAISFKDPHCTGYKNLERKYLKQVKTLEEHQKAINGAKKYIANEKLNNNCAYLKKLESIINQKLWQQWVSLDTVPETSSFDSM